MKRFKHIFSEIIDMDNLRQAHYCARKQKKHKGEVIRVDKQEREYLNRLQTMLVDKTFKNSAYKIFNIIDKGKQRTIYSLPYFPDRILHHAILQVIETIWRKTLIRDTFQSIKKRGVKDAKRRLTKFLQQKDAKYCLQIDISKFYPSVQHDILKTIIEKKISDTDVLWLLGEIIDSAPGIPIGNYISQYFGNIYLAYFDHYVKQKLKIKYYVRYADDIVLIHGDKDYLQYCLSKIEYYLERKLKLKIKPTYQIYPIRKRRIDFLGFRFDNVHIYLRKRIAKGFKSAARKYAAGEKSSAKALASYYGWMIQSGSWKLWNKYIKNFKQVKNDCK